MNMLRSKILLSCVSILFTTLLAKAVVVLEPRVTAGFTVQFYAGLNFTKPAGTVCAIEYNTEVSNTNGWVLLTNITLPTSPYLFIDTSAPVSSHRFYRLAIPRVTNPNPDKLVAISPGTFKMGSPEQQVNVTLTNTFFMGKNLVTQGEYLALMDSRPSANTGDPNLPVESLRWFEAKNYCDALTTSEQTAGRLPAGWAYRLPTEAEWEYACRAGTTTAFSFGDDVNAITTYSWCNWNSSQVTHPVGSKQPNPWGLYDMHGNLLQWCSDFYATPLSGGTNPTGPATGSLKVVRGGAFNLDPVYCSSHYRNSEASWNVQMHIGFRVVLAPVSQ